MIPKLGVSGAARQAVGTLVYFQFLTTRGKLNESGSDEGQQHASRVHDRYVPLCTLY